MTNPENLHIQTVETDSLNPAEYNPRKHTEKQMRDLCESISRYGMVDPIIVNGAV
jgi:ParB-like chromosome segregation protein Spo0J